MMIYNILQSYNVYNWVWGNKKGSYAKFYDMTDKSTKLVHRFVYEFYNGDIPKGAHIDHINRNSLDNRIENLRLASASTNLRNGRKRVSKSGYKGVYPSPINKNGEQYFLQQLLFI